MGTPCLFVGAVGGEEALDVACKLWPLRPLPRGLDRVSKRDMETALPGLRGPLRIPGVLDLDRPEAGEAVVKVMVGIKSVRRR